MINKFTKGVIYPIPPAFKDGKLCTASIEKYLNYLKDGGAKTVLTTAGTSRFNLLSDDEIESLNSTCATFDGVKILGIQPASNVALESKIDSINKLNPDAALLLYPDRYYDEKSIIHFFSWAANKLTVPVMIHGMFMRNAFGGMYDYTPEIIRELKQHPNIIGIKEECTSFELAYGIAREADENFLVFPAGGSCRRYLLTGPAGAQTFLGGIGNIFPAIEESFFYEFTNNNHGIAYDIVREFEDPLFKTFKKIGWHKALQIALNYKGLLTTENRAPFSEATHEQKIMVKEVIDDIETKWSENHV